MILLKSLYKLYYGRQYGYRILFKRQDKNIRGKQGIILADVGMPENYVPDFYNSYMDHVYNYSIPNFLHWLILTDKGMSLIDPGNPMAKHKFVPERLVDMHGSECNRAGKAYIECEIEWHKPGMKNNPWDYGYFLYREDGKGGAPNICQKVAAKVSGWYYGHLLPEKKVAWEYQCRKVFEDAAVKLAERLPYSEIMHASYTSVESLKKAVETLLERGCQTIVYLSFCNPVYTDFEEYASAMILLHDIIDGRARLVFAEQPGVQDSYQQAFVELVSDRLDKIDRNSSVMLILSRHGNPFKDDTGNRRGYMYRDPLENKMRELFSEWAGRWDLVWSDDEYADSYWDKKNKKFSTLDAFRKAIDEGYDYVLEMPTEFIAENTDKMIFHAMKKFTVFPDYDINEPVPYPDWDMPLERIFMAGNTEAISLGCPVGKYRKYIVEGTVRSILDLQDNNPGLV